MYKSAGVCVSVYMSMCVCVSVCVCADMKSAHLRIQRDREMAIRDAFPTVRTSKDRRGERNIDM